MIAKSQDKSLHIAQRDTEREDFRIKFICTGRIRSKEQRAIQKFRAAQRGNVSSCFGFGRFISAGRSAKYG